jgi:transposase
MPTTKQDLLPPLPPRSDAQREARNALIIADYTAGTAVRDLATKYNLSLAQTYRVVSGDEPQEVIKGIVAKYLTRAEQISDEFLELCEDDDKGIKLKAIQEYHKITGVSPTHTQSTVLQQVINAENVQVNQQMSELAEFFAWKMAQTQINADSEVSNEDD